MKPRSRRYFARIYTESAFANLVPIFDAIVAAQHAYMRLTTPIPRYPTDNRRPAGVAIVGEIGPELIRTANGQSFITTSRIFPLMEFPETSRIFPNSISKEGVYDVKVQRPFTPLATTAIIKID